MPAVRRRCGGRRRPGDDGGRLMDWGVVYRRVHPAGCGSAAAGSSRRWLHDWAARGACAATCCRMGCRWVICGCAWSRRARQVLETAHGAPADVLIANAVLDLVDVPAILPDCCGCWSPAASTGSRSITDGESIFRARPPHDDQVMQATTATMDERVRYGRPAGDSRTGAACSIICGLRGRLRWRQGRRTGS